MNTEPRVQVIEGRRALVVERRPPLPADLAQLLEGGRDADGRLWQRLRVVHRAPLRLGGTTAACLADDHRLTDWLEGFHNGSDDVTRYLHLDACADCGSVCVRDASFDVMASLPASRQGPRRKSHVIGWYSGARPGQRTYE